MTYRDFDLVVERAGDGLRVRVLASPAGTASREFRLPFSDVEIENVLLRLGRSRRVVRRVDSSELQTAKAFGATLFDAIFAAEVAECLQRSLDAVKRLGAGLRIRLRLADATLADLPWEYLYSSAVNRFLGLSIQTPLVRYIELPDSIVPAIVQPPIRALVMISSPADYPRLDVEGEWARLTGALADLVRSEQVAIDRLDNATLSSMQKQLRQAQYHIFHFIGHGEFDQGAQEGVLVLHDEAGRGHRVGSQYLGMLLHDHSSLRVAILNACEGARTSISDPFAGSAQTLVQQGIPAVIAMQFEIADSVASTFAHEFYGALADGYPIDASLTEARKALFAAGHDVAWATPVLYMRAPDGRIFDVERTDESREARDKASRVKALILDAGVALAHGEYEEAQQHLRLARTLDPTAENLSDLADTAEQQQAVADTRARLKRELRAHVAAAADLARHDHAAALARVRLALRLRPDDPEALALERSLVASRKPATAQPALPPSRTDTASRSHIGGLAGDPGDAGLHERVRGDAAGLPVDPEKDSLD